MEEVEEEVVEVERERERERESNRFSIASPFKSIVSFFL